jgi:hypothetical protein
MKNEAVCFIIRDVANTFLLCLDGWKGQLEFILHSIDGRLFIQFVIQTFFQIFDNE